MTDIDKESQSHMVELQLTKIKSSVQRVARLVAKVELRAEIFMQSADQARFSGHGGLRSRELGQDQSQAMI